MIDWLAFLFGGGAAGLVLTIVIASFRQGPNKPTFPFAKWLFLNCLFMWGSPFAAREYFTKKHEANIGSVVRNYFESADCPLIEKMDFYKVTWASGDKATVYMVGKELESWGGYDRPIMKLQMVRKIVKGKEKWYVNKGDVLRSNRLEKDSFIFPPIM
jgi:hypothetical protein